MEEEDIKRAGPLIWDGCLGFENSPRELTQRKEEADFLTFDQVREEWQRHVAHRLAQRAEGQPTLGIEHLRAMECGGGKAEL